MALAAYHTLVDNTAALSTLTLLLPVAPADGQRHYVTTVYAVTLLTVTGGTVKGEVPATLLASGTMAFRRNAAGAV